MPGFVLGDGLEDLHRLGIDAGQGSMGCVAALRAFLHHDGQCEKVDNMLRKANPEPKTALVAVLDGNRRTAEVGNSFGPQPGVAGLVREMLGHLELSIRILNATQQVEKKSCAA